MLRRFYTVMIVPHEGGALRRLSVSMNFILSMGAIFLFCFLSSAFLVHFFLGGAPVIAADERLRAENERINLELARTRGMLQETSLKLEVFADRTEELARAQGVWNGMGGGVEADRKPAGALFVAEGDWLSETRAILDKADYQLGQLEERLCALNAEPGSGVDMGEDVLWPVKGRITSGFGTRRDPFDGSKRFHEGVDIAAPFDTDVVVIADGIVIEARRHGGYGNMILVQHAGNRKTLYGHLRRLKVDVGERVTRGQVVGTVGSTGRATGPHVHFEVLENDRAVDPVKSLS